MTVTELIDQWYAPSLAAMPAAQKAASAALTLDEISVWWEPTINTFVVTGQDKEACESIWRRLRWEGKSEILPEEHIPNLPLVKLAYSPTLRKTMEVFNYYPGTYFAGIPNQASPLAALLTSGLIGAGAGYLGGKATELMMPVEKGKLSRTGAVLGTVAGLAPAVVYGLLNRAEGYGVLEPGLTGKLPHGASSLYDVDPAKREIPSSDKLAFVTLGNPSTRQKGISDVNIDSLNRTMWAAQTPDQIVSATNGVMYAASRMPGGSGGPVVTGSQLGQLAYRAGAGYLDGYLVGALLNKLTGIPVTPNQVGIAQAVNNTIKSVIPSLFGH